MMKSILTSLFVLMFSFSSFASISEAEYNSTLKLLEQHFSDYVRSKGGKLIMTPLWFATLMNATATRTGPGKTNWNVNMSGALARHPLMTVDAFVIATCHELGHHVGGAPLAVGEWFTAEGQADYWATVKCARRVWRQDDNISLITGRPVPAIVTTRCKKIWESLQDQALCTRIALAAQVTVEVLGNLRSPVSFETPDPLLVKTMNYGYPSAQCRLDTYFQGALCSRNLDDDVSNGSSSQGYCTKVDGFTTGTRPRCWYYPFQGEKIITDSSLVWGER